MGIILISPRMVVDDPLLVKPCLGAENDVIPFLGTNVVDTAASRNNETIEN